MLTVSGAGAMVPPSPTESENTNLNRDGVLKEGVLEKESNGLVSWKRKFCVLTRDSLVIYKKGTRKDDNDSEKNILYRVSLEDITSISNIEKGRNHIHFAVATKDAGCMDLRVGINQRDWITQIQLAVSARRSRNSFMNELKRKTSQVTHKYRKHGCKRLSFHKDPEYGDGIGITIRNEDDVIVVARIFNDGPAYKTGTLRLGDQIIEVNGQQVGGKHAEGVASIIKAVPDHVILYVKPGSVDRGTNTSAADFAMNRYYQNSGLNDRMGHGNLDVEVPIRPRSMGDILDIDDDIGAVPIYSLHDARRSRKESKKRGRHKKDKETIKQNRMSLPML
ncbi:uncharacterized protein [Amphiura filiformis]|uniref:uncharacterized protein isoform X2 n=1 Tax=Amphiura filiformis TaxID=82378 RepID=UPI003B22390E